VESRCGLHDHRTGQRDVINVVPCLNPAEEVLFSYSLETYAGFVGVSAFDLNRMYKHASTIFMAAEDQSCEFIIRKMTQRVSACGKCLTTDHKLEGQRYNNLAPNLCFGSHTQPKEGQRV